MDITDESLIKDYLSGDENSFKLLIDRYTPLMYAFALRFTKEDNAFDLTQEIFIKVWKNIKKFKREKSQFKTWLFVIARNTITDYLRKKKTIPFSALNTDDKDFVDTIEDKELLPDEDLIKLEDKKFLNELLDKLPVLYKEILVLYYQEDMTFDEIGKVLKKPLNTVKSYHRRSLLKLREMVEDMHHIY